MSGGDDTAGDAEKLDDTGVGNHGDITVWVDGICQERVNYDL